jgi:eukaryotic-like serine/threonine-protein kinase
MYQGGNAMSRKGRPSTSDLAKDVVHLPRHMVVLITIILLALVGAGAALVYFSFVKPPALPQPTPLVQRTVTARPTVHASPTARRSPTTQASPTLTSSPTVSKQPNPYPPHTGSLVLSDPLKDNRKGYRWDVGTFANGSSCTFAGGNYHVAVSTRGHVFACNAENGSFANLAYEVQMTILKGDRGGLFFRRIGTQGQFYYFSIKTDGSYELDSFTGSTLHVLQRGTSPAIKAGLNQTNLLAIVAQSNSITLYVNRQSIASVSDSTTNHGLIGLAAGATNQPAEVAFMNANVWML